MRLCHPDDQQHSEDPQRGREIGHQYRWRCRPIGDPVATNERQVTVPDMRIVWIFLGLAVIFIIPFAIWGDEMEKMLSGEGAVRWLESYRSWAWLAGYLLLATDLFLPVIATALISGLGYVYGVLIGGLIGLAGSVTGAMIGYGLCRLMGHGMAEKLLGKKDMARGEAIFSGNVGGWIVALSRWLPLLPEIVTCFAGLVRMPFRTFFVAVLCGAAPLAFTFAAVGKIGQTSPGLTLALSAVIPAVLWFIFGRMLLKGKREEEAKNTED